MPHLLIRSTRVVTPEGVCPADVRIRDGRIEAVGAPSGAPALDVGDRVVMPGIVDSHVHVNEPGRTEWEGFETATRAAAAGGITTIVDMPLNSRPTTTTVAGLEAKRRSAEGKCRVDVAFWGGVVPGNAGELRAMGLPGYKCFLVPSGVDEFPHVTERDLREAMPLIASMGAVLLVHAELAVEAPRNGSYSGWLRSRPREAENRAIEMMISLCREHRCRVHIVHLSSADAVDAIARAQREGLSITAETCPHYLTFAAEEIGDGETHFKCAPPIRERENRERLWAALAAGTIDMVVSDHSPCVPELKKGDFASAWGGIASLQFTLPAVWTEAHRRGHSLEDLARWMCAAPARLAGLDRKGSIEAGKDADLVVWNPEATFVVERVLHRHPLTPYRGRTLTGVVERTFVRGEPRL